MYELIPNLSSCAQGREKVFEEQCLQVDISHLVFVKKSSGYVLAMSLC